MECSWRLWPIPGIYPVTSILLVSRTRATFRRAEFGFLGVVVKTRVQTPRFWGQDSSAGDLRPLYGPRKPLAKHCRPVLSDLRAVSMPPQGRHAQRDNVGARDRPNSDAGPVERSRPAGNDHKTRVLANWDTAEDEIQQTHGNGLAAIGRPGSRRELEEERLPLRSAAQVEVAADGGDQTPE